jgi:hypothetical protein
MADVDDRARTYRKAPIVIGFLCAACVGVFLAQQALRFVHAMRLTDLDQQIAEQESVRAAINIRWLEFVDSHRRTHGCERIWPAYSATGQLTGLICRRRA